MARRSPGPQGEPLRSYMSGCLTRAMDETTERGLDNTYQGQAHWAGSGPNGVKCAACLYLVDRKHDFGRCSQFSRLMGGKIGKRFPAGAASCKYFAKGAAA